MNTKTAWLAFASPLIGTLGQVLLKHSMRQIGPVTSARLANPWQLAGALLLTPSFLAAAAVYALGFAVWLVILSKLDLSYAYPILALSFFLVPLLSQWFFGEAISPLRWAGIAFILFGVILVSRS